MLKSDALKTGICQSVQPGWQHGEQVSHPWNPAKPTSVPVASSPSGTNACLVPDYTQLFHRWLGTFLVVLYLWLKAGKSHPCLEAFSTIPDASSRRLWSCAAVYIGVRRTWIQNACPTLITGSQTTLNIRFVPVGTIIMSRQNNLWYNGIIGNEPSASQGLVI